LAHALEATALVVSQLGVAYAIRQDQGNAQQLAVELLRPVSGSHPTANKEGSRFSR